MNAAYLCKPVSWIHELILTIYLRMSRMSRSSFGTTQHSFRFRNYLDIPQDDLIGSCLVVIITIP
jgi:hypothetical protein